MAKIRVVYDGKVYEGICTNWDESPTITHQAEPWWVKEYSVVIRAELHQVSMIHEIREEGA